MNNNEYLSEERYQENVKKLKKVGKILLIIGIICLVLGIVLTAFALFGFGNTAVNGISSMENESFEAQKTVTGMLGTFGLFAISGLLSTAGFFMLFAGLIIQVIAHKREITAFSTQQVMPVAQEGIDKMAPTIGNAAGTIAKGIKDGLKDD